MVDDIPFNTQLSGQANPSRLPVDNIERLEVIEGAAKALEPHRVTFFLNELAGIFHSYYNKNRVITDDAALSRARLFLVSTIGQVLRNALGFLGVSAPEKM